jgi:2-succinyl-5-enolpyruvyl-6-hydroxy-3-cyclohexene-1-carboxylate synthase
MAFPAGIVELVDILSQMGVEEAVICPGSRNAPLMLALTRNPKINCYSISDERSAGFFGLGLVLKSKKPVVLCCTSGSAGLNFAPAVVEAFFQEIPLIILTADRPEEWIGQWDGQTIYQKELYGRHVKKFIHFPTDKKLTSDYYFDLGVDAYQETCNEPKGPVHLNIPISEPFYPSKGEELPESTLVNRADLNEFKQDTKVHAFEDFDFGAYYHASTDLSILITVGQRPFNEAENNYFEQLARMGIPVIGDATANLPAVCQVYHDLILVKESIWSDLKPDLHIHFGKSFVTKRIKQFLRREKPKKSWLIHPNPIGRPDPFQSLTQVINIETLPFLKILHALKPQKNNWKLVSETLNASQKDYFSAPNFTEIHIYNALITQIEHLELPAKVHVANSLAIRYVNWTSSYFSKTEVFSNRGTSGIDGCLSTAVGASQNSSELNICIIGDVAFHYDKNALWNQYVPNNLRIIVFNNGGGGIFRNLDGAKDLPELAGYMETKQHLTARNTCLDAGIDYYSVRNFADWNSIAEQFFISSPQAALVEIFSNSIENADELKKYMNLFRA